MIVIAFEDRHETQAQAIRAQLVNAFEGQDFRLSSASSPYPLEAEQWNDLLLLLFDAGEVSASLTGLAREWLATHRRQPSTLPVALDPRSAKPPAPLEHIKSMVLDDHAMGPQGRLVSRVGAILGLRSGPEERRIFISYRATDGMVTATALYERLNAQGFQAFMDEAREGTNLVEGAAVQDQLEARLRDRTDLVVLVDSPAAQESKWIQAEIHWANGLLIPMLPVCCHPVDDRSKGPRFQALRALSRYVDLSRWEPTQVPTDEQLEEVLAEVDDLISVMVQRRLKLPHLARALFDGQGYQWAERNRQRALYNASRLWKSPPYRQQHLVHCALTEGCSAPSLKALSALAAEHHAERDYYLYDGPPMADANLTEIFRDEDFARGRWPLVLHINALAAHLRSQEERV